MTDSRQKLNASRESDTPVRLTSKGSKLANVPLNNNLKGQNNSKRRILVEKDKQSPDQSSLERSKKDNSNERKN